MSESTTTEREDVWFLADRARIHVRGEDTGGAFSMVEMLAPAGDASPLHVHDREDETFHVLEGELSVHLPGRTVDLGAGDTLVAPRGVPHAYRVGGAGARLLVTCSPAGFEEFVCEAGEPAGGPGLPPPRPADPAALGAAAARYGIDILGPPGALPAE